MCYPVASSNSLSPTSEDPVQLELRVGVDGEDRLTALLPHGQVPPAGVHGQGPDASTPQGAQAGLLQGGQVQQLDQVACREGDHVYIQHHQIAALLTLVAKRVAGGGVVRETSRTSYYSLTHNLTHTALALA